MSIAFKSAKPMEKTCLLCPTFKCSLGHGSLFAWFAAVWRSVPNLYRSSSWSTTSFCLLTLLFVEFCAPGNTHWNCVSEGLFLHWLLWGWQEACKRRFTLPYAYHSSAERLAIISSRLITSLSLPLVTEYDVSSWRKHLRHKKTYLIKLPFTSNVWYWAAISITIYINAL